jgi:hypothetical protein
LSLLPLLRDSESAQVLGAVADFSRLPLKLQLTGESVRLDRDEVAEMSDGVLARTAEQSGD